MNINGDWWGARDWVPVNGFLQGLWQQRTPNGFRLTGFNHVPWYPLKGMQIVNQFSLLPLVLLHLLLLCSSYSMWSSICQSLCSYYQFPLLTAFYALDPNHAPVGFVSIFANKFIWTSSWVIVVPIMINEKAMKPPVHLNVIC